jgi:hypothetical protein
VELEREERLVEPAGNASILLSKTEREQCGLERRLGPVERPLGLFLKRFGGFLKRLWVRSDRLAIDVRQSKAGLDPDCERIVGDLRIAQPEIVRTACGAVDGSTQTAKPPIGRAARVGATLQRFGNDRVS